MAWRTRTKSATFCTIFEPSENDRSCSASLGSGSATASVSVPFTLFERIEREALRDIGGDEATHVLRCHGQLTGRRWLELVTLGQHLAESLLTHGGELQQVRDQIAAVQRLA